VQRVIGEEKLLDRIKELADISSGGSPSASGNHAMSVTSAGRGLFQHRTGCGPRNAARPLSRPQLNQKSRLPRQGLACYPAPAP